MALIQHPAFGVLLFALLYLGLSLWARRHWLVGPAQRLLLAQMEMLRVHLHCSPPRPAAGALTVPEWELRGRRIRILAKLKRLRKEVEGGGTGLRAWWPGLRAWWLGSEYFLKYWRIYHRLEAETVHCDESARFKWASFNPELLMQVPANQAQIAAFKELVEAARCQSGHEILVAACSYDLRDAYYQRLADWQNKAFWLLLMALLLMVLISLFCDPRVIFLAGGLGGLLAKLRGAILRADVPSDYGVSWTTLFLTPLIGSLTGWGGIQLLRLANEIQLINLPQVCFSSHTALFGLAIVFGYSATFFDKLFNQAQARLNIDGRR